MGEDYSQEKKKEGLQALWITPLRALSKDTTQALSEACVDMEVPWRVEARTGDTSTSKRTKQKKNMPQGLVTTPESLHVLFGTKEHRTLRTTPRDRGGRMARTDRQQARRAGRTGHCAP